MVGSARFEHLGQAIRVDAVELYSERATAGKSDRLAHAAIPGRPVLLEEAKGPTRIRADLVKPSLLVVELLDDNQREDDVVFIEAEDGVRISE